MYLVLKEGYNNSLVSLAAFKLEFGEYKVSLAFDTLYREEDNFSETSLCVYKDDKNVTKLLFDTDEIYSVDEKKFLEVCDAVSKLSKLSCKDQY